LDHRVQQVEVARSQQMTQAENRLQRAYAELVRAKDRAQWASRMHEKGYINEAQRRSDEQALKGAVAGVLDARQRLEALRGDAPEEAERRDDERGAARTAVTAERLDLSGSLERRLETIERKLDRVLELLEAAEPSDDPAPSRR